MPGKMTKRQALEWAKSLPDDDDESVVHVVKVRKTDPDWAWLFGPTKSSDASDDADETADDDAGDDDEGKPEPKPKGRNRYFGGN